MVGKAQENEILVGKKPLSKYMLSLSIIGSKHNEVIIKARGRNIPRAILLAETGKDMYGFEKTSVETSVAEVESQEGKPIRIPHIEIRLEKK